MLIGYMDPDIFLGGAMPLDAEAAWRVFEEKIARPARHERRGSGLRHLSGRSAQISDLIHEITVERGLDPRDFVLHAFGGSCGMVAGMFGAELGVKQMVVPYTASVNCAFGLVSADIVHEYSMTAVLPVAFAGGRSTRSIEPMVAQARRQLKEEGFDGAKVKLEWSVDLRYSRQVHEVTTPVRGSDAARRRGLAATRDRFRSAVRAQIWQRLGLSVRRASK